MYKYKCAFFDVQKRIVRIGQTQLEVVIVFCSNCGSPLAEGAKFCSECGTKVEETKKNDFGILEAEELSNISDTLAGKAPGVEEAFDARVSFDWSNVIDEPQKKEVPQGIKSPWATTTGNIDERELYSEMLQSDDKNRTLSYIDVFKADREERERAALDKSIEYTEVLEYDPEMVGGTKPPKLRMAPLYEDVDAPVKTPFDDMDSNAQEENHIPSFEQPAHDKEEKQETKVESTSARFEFPDFLKKAVGFGVGKEEVVEIEKEEKIETPAEEPVVEETVAPEPVVEETATPEYVVEKHAAPEYVVEKHAAPEPVVEETATPEYVVEKHAAPEPVVEETVAPEPVVEETVVEETQTESAEDDYLDEDLYLELSEPPRSDRISRIDAHAAEYAETTEEDADEPIDEEKLFTEMSEPEHKKTGMTIAAPADEEAEIEALKKRLAELTGTVEIDPALLAESEAEETVEETVAPIEEIPEEGSFEALGSDFTFEPEVTPADNAMFEDLTPASEQTAPVIDSEPEPTFDDFMFEPEVTPADDAMFAGLTPASEPTVPTPEPEAPVTESVAELSSIEPAAEIPSIEPVAEIPSIEPVAEAPSIEPAKEPVFGLSLDDEITANVPPAVEPAVPTEQPPAETAVVETIAETSDNKAEQTAEDALFAAFTPKETQDDSPIVGFAPAVTEASNEEVPEPPVATEPAVISLDDFASEAKETTLVEETYTAEPVVELEAGPEDKPVIEPITEKAAADTIVEEPKTTDALSLEDLEKGFSASGEETGAETTKKIDKFYTLYKKNEEFQRLLDEEFIKKNKEQKEVPNEATVDSETANVDPAVFGEIKDLGEQTTSSPAAEATLGLSGSESILGEIATESKPPEDATIYQMNMPEDLAEIANNAENNSGFSVEGTEDKSFGLGEAAGTVAAGAAAGAALTKAEKKAAKKAEKKAKKEAAKNADPQVEYENVDSGSTILTILAVLVAVLLVLLLAIILILHIAPGSELALQIDSVIENITSNFSAVNRFGGHRLI